jgi:hypothetical protein
MIDEAPELAALAAGLDPADPDFALRLMARDLSQRRRRPGSSSIPTRGCAWR